MALDHNDRTLLGLVVAPIATVPILSLVGAATLLDKYSVSELVPGTIHISFFFALFGLPVAYAVEAVLVLLLRALGRTPGTASSLAVVALGSVGGLLVFGLLGLDSLGNWAAFAGTGALMGGGASSLFVLIRGRQTNPRAAS